MLLFLNISLYFIHKITFNVIKISWLDVIDKACLLYVQSKFLLPNQKLLSVFREFFDRFAINII